MLESLLGEGGMGAVYRARHPLIGKRVAIKVMKGVLASDDAMAARFFSEARAVNEIRHPNIVDIIDFGRTDSLLYFTMEQLEGESLADRLSRTGVSIAEARHIALQCCSALDASHRHNIVHRDLKPENIFLCRRGADANYVKILDFGLAKMARGEGGYKTGQGEIFGTPDYMSPEQCESAALADARSDIYSFGIVLYEMLTRHPPFAYETIGETLIAHLMRTPLPPSQINPAVEPALEAVVMRALEKDRAKRFQSMGEFAAALREPESHLAARPGRVVTRKTPAGPTRQFQRGGSVAAHAVTMRVASPMQRPRKRRRAWAVAAAVLALLVGALGGRVHVRSTTTRPSPATLRSSSTATPTPIPIEATRSFTPPLVTPRPFIRAPIISRRRPRFPSSLGGRSPFGSPAARRSRRPRARPAWLLYRRRRLPTLTSTLRRRRRRLSRLRREPWMRR